jgi:hypothetical protein
MRRSATPADVLLDAVDVRVHVQLVRPGTSMDGSCFCQLLWQPGLWDEGALVEITGRIGQPGVMQLTRYPGRAAAQPRVTQRLLHLVRQGYDVVEWQ